MRIAFHTLLKPPDHPTPSGDRTMARLLIASLQAAGHEVILPSRWRAHGHTADVARLAALQAEAATEARSVIDRLAADPPSVWLAYHPYYKAPDLLGPAVAAGLGLAYVTIEASHAAKRDAGAWAPFQAALRPGLRQAALHLCLTEDDRDGLAALLGTGAPLALLPPCLDTTPFEALRPAVANGSGPVRLITIAMMRPGVKLESYALLASSLATLSGSWTLDIIGDGPAHDAVHRCFASVDPARLRWHGRLDAPAVRAQLRHSHLFVWPGIGEAYGMAYLEAAASGLPSLAINGPGVASVIRDGETGRLADRTPPDSFARALHILMQEPDTRARLGQAARAFALTERSLPAMTKRLDTALRHLMATSNHRAA